MVIFTAPWKMGVMPVLVRVAFVPEPALAIVIEKPDMVHWLSIQVWLMGPAGKVTVTPAVRVPVKIKWRAAACASVRRIEAPASVTVTSMADEPST